MKSWRTTVSGIILALGLLLTNVGAFVDEDPETKGNINEVTGALLALGGAIGLGWFSRDKNVSSEAQGVK